MNPKWGQFFMAQRGQFRMAFDISATVQADEAVATPERW